MLQYHKSAPLQQLEEKATRQQLALDATHAMIDLLLRSTPVDKEPTRK